MERKIRIVDIARMAGVSVGTVDRVLHGRGRVSKDKREKIESVLKEINYEPNMVARFLASGKSYEIAVLIPAYVDGEYWSLMVKGINNAVGELQKFNFDIRYFFFDQYDKASFDQAVNEMRRKVFDGVVVATIFEDSVVSLSKELDRDKVPYIYIDSPIVGQGNLSYYGGDSFGSGFIAARLMTKLINEDSDIFIFHIHSKQRAESVQMKNREAGFLDYLKKNNYRGKIHCMEMDIEDEAHAVPALKDALNEVGGVAGGIVFNSRIHNLTSVLNEIDHSLQSKMKLIGYDTIPTNITALKQGLVAYLLSQRPELQGYDSVKAIGNYYLFKQIPEKKNYMPIDILIKENIDYYTH